MTDRIEKFKKSLSPEMRRKLKDKLRELSLSPLSMSNIKKLKGCDNLYRLRFGKIRIIYKLTDGKAEVLSINYRDKAYENLS